MPRKHCRQLGARKYVDYTQERLNKALTAVAVGNLSLREAEERYGIPRATLNRKYHGRNPLRPGRQPVLGQREEEAVVNAITSAAKWGYPMTYMGIRELVKNYLDRKGAQERRFTDNLPGYDWTRLGFIK